MILDKAEALFDSPYIIFIRSTIPWAVYYAPLSKDYIPVVRDSLPPNDYTLASIVAGALTYADILMESLK